jgi:mxaJ protein
MFLHYPEPRLFFSFLLLVLWLTLPIALDAKSRQAEHLRKLRVCADPNNLPFSNQRGEGFENRLAELLAQDLGAQLEYTWWGQRQGFLRHTLNAGLCDVVMGVPQKLAKLETTVPYYRSSYVFVTRQDRGVPINLFEAAVLRQLKIDGQLRGDEGANVLPVPALTAQHLLTNRCDHSRYDENTESPLPAHLIAAVAQQEIEVVIMWGPLAGYFARQQATPLTLTPVLPAQDSLVRPFAFDISIGVRRGEIDFKEALNQALLRHRGEIESLLDDYGIPRSKE